MDFKKTLLIACLFVGFNTVAQNRLEFNRIVSLSGSITSSSGGTISQLDTVPVGKAYKITAFHHTSDHVGLSINNLVYQYTSQNTSLQVPVWLKEGDILSIQYTWNAGSGTYHISAIEFNIVTD